MFRDKDPAIDELRTELQDHFGVRNLTWGHFKEVEARGGAAATTLHSQLNGVTLRPQNATIEASGRAIGRKRVWVSIKAK